MWKDLLLKHNNKCDKKLHNPFSLCSIPCNDLMRWGDYQKTILSGWRRPRGESFPKNLKEKERWRNWRQRSTLKYWTSIEMSGRRALACFYVSQVQKWGRVVLWTLRSNIMAWGCQSREEPWGFQAFSERSKLCHWESHLRWTRDNLRKHGVNVSLSNKR